MPYVAIWKACVDWVDDHGPSPLLNRAPVIIVSVRPLTWYQRD
jgi:hypothetical protein